MSAPVVIDARAAIRRETGGVERVAQELARRLPELRPERYETLAPRPRLAHGAGHAWEQLVLPLAARRAALILCPANLAPLASRRNVVVIHDVAALAHPEWYGRAYVAWQRAALPAIARRARLVITVSEFSRREIAERLGVELPGRPERRGGELLARARIPARRQANSASSAPTCSRCPRASRARTSACSSDRGERARGAAASSS